MIAISPTFDDGPDPVWTPRVLEALAQAGARATFFVMAGRAAAHPELVAAILDGGHDVGLHCLEHVRHPQTTRAAIEADTDAALALLAELGVHPTLWRLPWGREAFWSRAVARERGLEIVGWHADTHDWRGDGAETMLEAIAPRLGPGAVVLAHDGLGPGATRDGCAETVRLIGLLADAGFAMEPVRGATALSQDAAVAAA